MKTLYPTDAANPDLRFSTLVNTFRDTSQETLFPNIVAKNQGRPHLVAWCIVGLSSRLSIHLLSLNIAMTGPGALLPRQALILTGRLAGFELQAGKVIVDAKKYLK